MNEYVLGLSKGIGLSLSDPIRWQNTLTFIFPWLLIFAVLKAGIKEAGKIIWFTALFPYLVLTIFLIRASLLEGADYGIRNSFLYFLWFSMDNNISIKLSHYWYKIESSSKLLFWFEIRVFKAPFWFNLEKCCNTGLFEIS